jgi:biopolymer transport protein TolQ
MPEVTASTDLMSPLNLFMQADIVVKLVMVGLLLASVWTWAIIFTHAIRLKRVNRQTDAFEKDFWAAKDIDAFHARHSEKDLPIAVVMSAAPEPASGSPAG